MVHCEGIKKVSVCWTFAPSMSTLLDHGSVRTTAVEQVVAPMASHLCHLVLLCDGADEPEQFLQLEGAAEAVARATQHLASVAHRQAEEKQDEVLQMEMSSLVESLTVSGQHVLLAAQKLNIQPSVSEYREELITATQNVFLGVVKVLLVSDDAIVRKVLAAADQVLETLSDLGSSPDIKTLLRSFRSFSDALLAFNSLTVDRAHSLQDPQQKQRLLECLETLKRCISMLHTAMCTTIKHPASEQAQNAKTYILDKVQNTVRDIVITLKSESHMGSQGAGFYTWRRDSLTLLLSNPLEVSDRDCGFDSVIRDIVFHCMSVANSSRRELQQSVVGHCKHILKFWSDIKRSSKSDDLEELEDTCSLLEQQMQLLDKVVTTAVLYQVLDTFLTASSMNHELSTVLKKPSEVSADVSDVLTLIEDFISFTDKIIQVANFVSALACDAKSLERVETSIACLTRLRERILPLSLELEDNVDQTIQKLIDASQKWDEETNQLEDAFSCIINVQEFTSLSISEMVIERHGCDKAYREQSVANFNEHSANLVIHMKLVMQAARRHLDRSDDPIYRNGLLVLLKQVQASVAKVSATVGDMLTDINLNIEAYSSFSDSVSAALQHFKVLRGGLDGQQHPHLLSPLRQRARQPDPPLSPSPVTDMSEMMTGNDHVVSYTPECFEYYPHSELEEEEEDEEEIAMLEELPHKYDKVDLRMSDVSPKPQVILKPSEFDLLPLLYEVVTVTKGKDVTVLNQACTSVLELSNCYAQAAKEALLLVDYVGCQTLESFRAELVSLTPLLVQTAQETAMSSAMKTESIYKLCTQFSDLINNVRKVLLPLAGRWYSSLYNMIQENRCKMVASISQELTEVISLCSDVVQELTSSDIKSQSDGQETFGVLHNKLNKAQNNTRYLADFSSSPEVKNDQLEGLCILWGLSVKILLQSLDKILGTSSAMSQVTPQKQLSALSENSLRVQEAARNTSQNCKSAYKVKQFTGYQEELKTITEAYLNVTDHVDAKSSVKKLAKSEFLKRNLLVKMKAVCSHLSKVNNDYERALQSLVDMAFHKARHVQNDETNIDSFEKAAETLFEKIKSGTKRTENCLHFIRDPRCRSNLRSINEHLLFQLSDIVSRARLIVETRHICDTLAIEVQIQSWAAKANFLVEELWKQEGINQGTKESIRAALQGQELAKVLVAIKEVLPEIPLKINEPLELQTEDAAAGYEDGVDKIEFTFKDVPMTPVFTCSPDPSEKEEVAVCGLLREVPSLTHRSLYLKQESNHWDPEDNKIVQVTRKMADTICHMTQYLKKKGPIPNKDAFVAAAKDVISNCESVTQFIRVIANHCLDKQCTMELSLIVEQTLTITNQLSIISSESSLGHLNNTDLYFGLHFEPLYTAPSYWTSVNAVTPTSKSSDEILVKNAQNLLQTILKGVHAAESACITGLKQPEPNTECAEATALCFQWRRNLEMHRAQQTSNLETDDLGLRKTSAHPEAPSLAPPVNVQDTYK